MKEFVSPSLETLSNVSEGVYAASGTSYNPFVPSTPLVPATPTGGGDAASEWRVYFDGWGHNSGTLTTVQLHLVSEKLPKRYEYGEKSLYLFFTTGFPIQYVKCLSGNAQVENLGSAFSVTYYNGVNPNENVGVGIEITQVNYPYALGISGDNGTSELAQSITLRTIRYN